MRIITVPGVSPKSFDITSDPSAPFLEAVLGAPKKLHYLSRTGIATPTGRGEYGKYPAPTVSLLVQAVHHAFSHHIPLSLAPEVLWYAIVHEVSQAVNADPGTYAHYFTTTPGEKQEIYVEDNSLVYGWENDWNGSIGLVKGPLKEKIAGDVLEDFLPHFSTLNPESEAAILVSFMDVISKYYDFAWGTLCGIPAIRLEGEPHDWEMLCDSARRIAERMPVLSGYFNDLVPVLDALAAGAAGVRVRDDFWKSIYKVDSMSGGPYVGGWITAFFAYLKDHNSGTPALRKTFGWDYRQGHGFKTNAFSSHVSKVDFEWRYLEEKIPMSFAGGILGVDHVDGFLAPRLGVAVLERDNDKK